jgi:hypothetical protein
MIPFQAVEWDADDFEGGNVRHIAEHDITPEEVEDVLYSTTATDGFSRASGRHMRFGWTTTGRFLAVAYKIKQGRSFTSIRPITAYPVDPH